MCQVNTITKQSMVKGRKGAFRQIRLTAKLGYADGYLTWRTGPRDTCKGLVRDSKLKLAILK